MHSHAARIARRKLVRVGLFSAATVATLVATRPHVSGAPTAWPSETLLLVAAWLLALVVAAWLSLACVASWFALRAGRPEVARRFARLTPAFVRRAVETAVVLACIASQASAAHAAPATAPTTRAAGAPIVVHVGADGVLSLGSDDQPVVRTPPAGTPVGQPGRPVATAPAATTPATSSPTTTAAATTAPAPASAAPNASEQPVERTSTSKPAPHAASSPPAPAAAAPSAATRRYQVRAGDNLWSIAKHELVAAGLAHDDVPVARYWQRVITANRATLRSGDPSVIHPGEIVSLPPLTS